jgi:hypothetical protein
VISAFFLRPNETPQLLAKFASVLLAVMVGLVGPAVAVLVLVLSDMEVGARGDARGTWYDEVLRRLCLRTFDTPSDIESSGEGVVGLLNGFASAEEGDDESISCSARAVVGGAFVPEEPDEALPRGGMRPTENREVVEMRDAREPGRKGELSAGAWWGMEPVWWDGEAGEAGGGGDVGGDGVLLGDGIGSNCESGGAWASKRDKEEGRTGGDEVERDRTGKRCKFGE